MGENVYVVMQQYKQWDNSYPGIVFEDNDAAKAYMKLSGGSYVAEVTFNDSNVLRCRIIFRREYIAQLFGLVEYRDSIKIVPINLDEASTAEVEIINNQTIELQYVTSVQLVEDVEKIWIEKSRELLDRIETMSKNGESIETINEWMNHDYFDWEV
jgi:hypothetical protein